MHSPQNTLTRAVDRASEITWWNRNLTKLNRIEELDNALSFAETDLLEQEGPYVELVKAPRAHDQSATEFLDGLDYSPDIQDAVVSELFGGDKSGSLYQHQVETIEAIENGNSDTILSVPTATGKTEAFFLPILNHCLQTDESGLKSLIIYPMKTLSVDQLNRFLTYLYHVNRDRAPEDQVTIGIWDGDTPHDVGSRDYEIETGSYIRGLECPKTGEKLRVLSGSTVGTDETKYSWVKVTRNSIQQGVDILLTNPEALDHIFVNNSAETRQVLGSQPSEHPLKHIVYDEAHVWSGISGAAISLLTQRLKSFYSERDPQVSMVSATVENPTELAAALTHSEKEDITPIEFTGREITRRGTADFSRFEPCTLDSVAELLGRIELTDIDPADVEETYPHLEGTRATLEEVGLVSSSTQLTVMEDWVVAPLEERAKSLLADEDFDSVEELLESEEGIEELTEAIAQSGGTTSQWFDFVIESVPEVAAFASWFETDTTGSVGFKKYNQLIEEVANAGVGDPEAVLSTVMLFGRLAGIVTEKYHAFLKPPHKVHWCRDCQLVSRSNACRECDEPIPEMQFCRRCHHPYREVVTESEEAAFAPLGDDEPVGTCPGCQKYVNLSDIGVPTATLLSFMLTEVCRAAPSKKTLVFSDSHSSAESVGGEIIDTEYGLMAEGLYVKELFENGGVKDNYELFQSVSHQLREAYYEPLYQNEIDEDSQTYNILRQLREDITSNAMIRNCRHLFTSALVMPESLYQATSEDVDARIIGHELYALFAGSTPKFSRETAQIEGLTYEKICNRIAGRTTYEPAEINERLASLLDTLLEERVIIERSWEDVRQNITEADIDEERQDKVFDYIEAQRDELTEHPALGRTFDSGVFGRNAKEDQSDLRLVPRAAYCMECFTSHPVPIGATLSRCRSCGESVETYDRFEVDANDRYTGIGYAAIDSDWRWPLDHWAYEVSRPLNDEEGPRFITVGIHKGNIPPTLRGAIEESFRKDEPDVNIVSATPTMELGVDIGSLETVTQVGIPPTLTNYVQRSGRTGRKRGSSSLVMTVIRGEHPVDNHYYANLDGFFRSFEPVRVPDPYEFDELLAGQVVTLVVGYLARNPHESNIFQQLYELKESNTDLGSYVSNVEERLSILQEFIQEEMDEELRRHVAEVFGDRGVEVFEAVFFGDGGLSLAHRVDQTFTQLAAMSGSSETNKRLSERHNRLDSWLSLLGYLANYRDFGQQFPVKFSGRQDSIEFESSGRLYDMFPGEENGRGSVLSLHGSEYIVEDVHGTTTPLSQVTLCTNDECKQPFQTYPEDTRECPHCAEPLVTTNVHGIGSVECRTARGGEKNYTTRGIMSTDVRPSTGGSDPQVDERELFGLPCTVEQGEYNVTDFVYVFERGHSRSAGRETLRSEAVIERKKGEASKGTSWEDRLKDVTEETYAPVGQRYHTRGLKLTFPRAAVTERFPELSADDINWPQLLASLEQAFTKAVAIVADCDQQDFRLKTTLADDRLELFLVDSQQGGNGITWQVTQELTSDLLDVVRNVASCEKCADYCEECLLLSRTSPAYLENDLLNKYTLRAVVSPRAEPTTSR